ncbi:MAG: glycosyltransferase, partial [Lachnospiraceae bacterium]|nr:glycosyltransferase [Lachnospiraceae bacterium]
CKNMLDNSGIEWTYRGTVTGNQVFRAFSANDVFLFPTMGENFGHVISEALCAGCPVITSDRTPWNDLSEHGVGFSLSLPNAEEDYHEWTDALKHYAEMSADEFAEVSENCVSYIRSKIDIDSLKAAYRVMFEDEMEGISVFSHTVSRYQDPPDL